jgi:SAM-dependent methyltransferase
VLETLGLFAPDAQGAFRNTVNGEMLRSDHPSSVRQALLNNLSAPFWRPMGELYESVQSGQPAFDHIFGQSFFNWLSQHPAESDTFAKSMNAATKAAVPLILSGWDFSPYRVIVDVGGGHGALLAGILSAYPGAYGLLYDLPAVTAGARVLQTGPLAARCEVISGNFFDSIPERGDVYLLRSVVHDWNDENALAILRNCRRAMRPGTTLLLVEYLLDSGSIAELLDLHMIVLTGGRERTLLDYERLLGQAGFRLTRVAYTAGPTILESLSV